jgi:hypothetical protein
MPDDRLVPPLDRSRICERGLTLIQRQWRLNGYVILRRAIPVDLCRDYAAWRQRRALPDEFCATPDNYAYMFVPEIRRIALMKSVADVMQSLIGESMVLQFDLTPWKSTERAWHQDDYLNDATINGCYAAVWFAIDDIDPDSGPFEFIPGSHRWPVMRRDRVKALLPPEQADSPSWPSLSQDMVEAAIEPEIAARQGRRQVFAAQRGDVLIWHARLVHRGSRPRNPSLARKSLIGHYRGLSTVLPEHHEIRYTSDGVPFIHHRQITFQDFAPETGVQSFIPEVGDPSIVPDRWHATQTARAERLAA